MKTWNVHFQVTLPDDCEWTPQKLLKNSELKYTRIDPGPNDPFICVPHDAVITEAASDGFYVHGSTRLLYKRENGHWDYWCDTYKNWSSSSLTDEDLEQNDLHKIDVVF